MNYNSLSMSEQFKIYMKRKGVQLKDLAEKLDILPSGLANRFKRNNLRESEIKEIADALGVTVIMEVKIEE